MKDNEKVCKNCAYAAVRSDTKRFGWCKYLCTRPADEPARHIAYKYENDTCEHFLPQEK